eukprot:1173935-Prorocentrum_minimum.AAC.2
MNLTNTVQSLDDWHSVWEGVGNVQRALANEEEGVGGELKSEDCIYLRAKSVLTDSPVTPTKLTTGVGCELLQCKPNASPNGSLGWCAHRTLAVTGAGRPAQTNRVTL